MSNYVEGLKLVAPQIPGIASAAVLHSLGATSTSSKWDLRTAITVQALRGFMAGGGSSKKIGLAKVQRRSMIKPEIKGNIWVATATMKAPLAGEEAPVYQAIEDMKTDPIQYQKATYTDIEVEWTGYRSDVKPNEPAPNVSEQEKYDMMMADKWHTSDATVLYVHGGAYYLCDPGTHRALTSRIAKHTGGPVCSVRYRLAPQTAFPGQLLDAFMVYLNLLYPPPGSMHKAIPAKNIVIAGDSAGGNLAFALQQLLVQFHRSSPNPTVQFHGATVEVPMSAGACANSGWFDIGRSMPSSTTNVKTDYLPEPSLGDFVLINMKHDEIWPTNPPRGDTYTDLSMLDHPLVSPLAAESWAGSSPLWIITGEELLTDEDCIVAKLAASQGVKVHFEQYEAMPHCFAMVIPSLAASERCIKSWAAFIRKCVDAPETMETNATFIHAKSGKEDVIDIKGVTPMSVEHAKKIMKSSKDKRMSLWETHGVKAPKPLI